jgi:hypothetical protein
MLVERYVWEAKPGRREGLVEWLQELVARDENKDLTTRVYTTEFGAWNRVALEVEYETEEARQQYWAGIEWTEDIIEFVKKLADLVEPGETRELLQLR